MSKVKLTEKKLREMVRDTLKEGSSSPITTLEELKKELLDMIRNYRDLGGESRDPFYGYRSEEAQAVEETYDDVAEDLEDMVKRIK
jgi:hypothetical protein